MAKISVVINTLNEEKNIKTAIESVKSIASEIVVVDMESEDDTPKIAKSLGAKVYFYKKTGYVEPARNYAISKAHEDFILVLDADEVVPETLCKYLKKQAKNGKADYYRVPRRNIVFKKWLKHSRWWPDYNIRFFKKGHVSWNELIHSVPLTTGKGIEIPAQKEMAIIHHHYLTVSQYVLRMDRYTTIQANAKQKEGEKFSVKKLVSKPSGEFYSRFFQAKGYRDGVHGLVLAALQAFSEMVVYIKLWELEGFKERKLEMSEFKKITKKETKNLFYWMADMAIGEGGGLLERLKRKFRLS